MYIPCWRSIRYPNNVSVLCERLGCCGFYDLVELVCTAAVGCRLVIKQLLYTKQLTFGELSHVFWDSQSSHKPIADLFAVYKYTIGKNKPAYIYIYISIYCTYKTHYYVGSIGRERSKVGFDGLHYAQTQNAHLSGSPISAIITQMHVDK